MENIILYHVSCKLYEIQEKLIQNLQQENNTLQWKHVCNRFMSSFYEIKPWIVGFKSDVLFQMSGLICSMEKFRLKQSGGEPATDSWFSRRTQRDTNPSACLG